MNVLSSRVKEEIEEGCVPGTIREINKDGSLDVQTGSGVISLHEVQVEGKKRMPAAAWANGQRLKGGEMFGE